MAVSGSTRQPSKMVKKFTALRREIARVRRQAGVWEVLRRGGTRSLKLARSLVFSRRQEIHPFDLEHGTDTSGTVDVGALDLPPERADQAVRYQTAIVEVFTEMLERLPGGGENQVFVDLGSGKGRALLLASRLPFKEIIGVELSADLHAIACRNIAIYRDDGQRCNRIRSLCQDAGSFEFPPEKLVIYLFNPFGEQVMREVVSRIEDSLKRNPRRVHVMYLKPLHRQLFDQSEWFEVLQATERYVIYRSKELVPA